jgi:hypothetical protein
MRHDLLLAGIAHAQANLYMMRQRMADHHEIKRLAARSPAVMAALGARAAQLNARLDVIEKRGGAALDNKSALLDTIEGNISQIEDYINQMGNSPLEGSPGDSLGAADANGVRINKAGA